MAKAGGAPLTLEGRGVRKLAVVDAERLWRGGNVQARGVVYLHSLGCRRLIDLTRRERPVEARACRRAAITYRKIPLSDALSPAPGVVDDILELLDDGTPTLVHCWQGRHRTGLVIAAYRVHRQHWTVDAARAEMLTHGYGSPSARPSLWEAVADVARVRTP